MELGTIATVVTNHLTLEVATVLNKRFLDNDKIEDPNHWSNDLQWAGFEYGWLLSIAGDRFDRKSPEFVENENDDIPQCIRDVAYFAKKRGARWICFDRDAGDVEGLPTYDW